MSPVEQDALGRQMSALHESDLEDNQKARLLVLALIGVVGERVLRQAIIALAPEIGAPPA